MVINLKRGFLGWIITACLWVSPAHAQKELLDYIVAVVENEVILNSDISQLVDMYRVQNPKDVPADIEKQIFEKMIDTRALIAYARKDSVLIPTDQVDSAVRQFTDQLRQEAGSQEALEQKIAEYGLAIRDWLRLLRQQKEDELLQRKLEEARFGQIRVSGLEVQRFYETHSDSLPDKQSVVSMSHIMMTIKPDPEREAAVRKRIEAIQAQIMDQGDFGEIAKKYSEDLASAKTGGDLGFFSRGTFVETFEDTAFALKPGEMSGIMQTRYGFHLIKKEEEKGVQIRARHIFLQLPLKPEDDARTSQTLEFLRQRILSGAETFEEAAKKYSEDIESSVKNGDLGEFIVEQLQPQYRSIVDTLTVGLMSAPVKIQDNSEDSYHILRVNKRTGGGKLTLKDDYETLTNMAKQEKWNAERRRWLSDMRADLHIEERGLNPPDSN